MCSSCRATCSAASRSRKAIVPPNESRSSCRLFRNDLAPSEGTALRFTDVTEASRIDVRGYGMGAATGDIDNDGCVDLYVTKLGPNQLLAQQLRRHVHRRHGREPHRRIRDGAYRPPFVDYRSRRLARSVRRSLPRLLDRRQRRVLQRVGAARLLSTQRAIARRPSHLFHNNRDGTFSDVTARSRHVDRIRARARRLHCGLQRRRLDRSLRRQRRCHRISCGSISATERSRTRRFWRGAAVSAEGEAQSRAWAWTPATSTTTATRICFVAELTGQGADL